MIAGGFALQVSDTYPVASVECLHAVTKVISLYMYVDNVVDMHSFLTMQAGLA